MKLERRPVRALFVSDLHIGMKSSRVDRFLDLLSTMEPKTIYLVGDIVDGWSLTKSWRWNAVYSAFLDEMIRLSRSGVRVYYLPGNHDEFARPWLGGNLGRIRVVDRIVHRTATGKPYLVLHGDAFDAEVATSRGLRLVGEAGYRLGTLANLAINGVRSAAGLPDWSLLAYLRRKVPAAMAAVERFERAAADAARQIGAQGVICGHIHHPADHSRHGVHYLNTGDWVDNFTAAVELGDGSLHLLRHNEGVLPVASLREDALVTT